MNQASQPGTFDSQQIIGTLGQPGVPDRIVFANGVNDPVNLFGSGPATIELEHGELFVFNAVRIEGPGWDLLTIDASQQANNANSFVGDGDGVFSIGRSQGGPVLTEVLLSGMTITGGDALGGGGVDANASDGESFTFRDLKVAGNKALSAGGGLRLIAAGGGAILLENSLVQNNELSPQGTGDDPNPYVATPNHGAGIAVDANGGGTIEIDRVSSTGNASTFINSFGGGLGIASTEGTIRVTDSLFSGNTVGRPQSLEEFYGFEDYFDQQDATVGLGGNGGGIGIEKALSETLPNPATPIVGTLEFIGVSLLDNEAYGAGGGFFHDLYDYAPNFDLVNALVYNNRATYGGGVYGSNGAIRHTTIASNKAGFGGTAGFDVYGGAS